MLDSFYRHVLLPPIKQVTKDDAETAHDWFLSAMRKLNNRPRLLGAVRGASADPILGQTLMDGVHFPSPFGVAAGLDKNAAIIHSVEAVMRPGFIEVGTVTPKPQIGNPRPRIVRANGDNLINAMGFPNGGLDAALQRLETTAHPRVPLGLNVGKMKETSEEDAPAEYARLVTETAALRKHRALPDYYVINVSSPNTPGLTTFQKIEPLTAIVTAVASALDAISTPELDLKHRLLVKLGADLELDDLEPIVQLILNTDIGGLITTNTTVARPISSRYNERPGGFSGSDLYDRSSRLVRHTASLLPTDKVLIAAGGVDTVDRAYEMLQYADLVAGYTGLVLKGPHLFKRLSAGVAARMRAQGVESLGELRSAQRPSAG